MDRKQAQKAVGELFTQPFDRERYQHFLRNLLNNFEARENKYYKNARLWDQFWPHINHYERIGKYTDPDGARLDLLIVEVPSFSKLEKARTTLRNLVVKHLKTFGGKDFALVAFYAKDDGGADWRFSFIKIEHEAYQDEKGKVKTKEELTPAKRYSYLVGVHENSHTAGKQLVPLLEMDYADPRIEEIEAAFSIEKVTDEFFEQYRALFQKLAEHLKVQPLFNKGDETERDQQVSRFAKKLLGQIVFLYFLQKKGWLGVDKAGRWGEGPKRFMRKHFNQIQEQGCDYYHDFLQYLFYEALADERKEQKDPGYYPRFGCRVPFLNGGLFEPDYDWRKESIDLPNGFFHNIEKNKNGDIGTGILDVFDRYNFTIKEDEPLEKEVAVDPEMLGKVFENMLEVTERKSKGAFYTPREIVHYMCQESLIHYLDNRLNTYASTPELVEPQADIFGSSAGQKSLGDTEAITVPISDLETLIRKGHLALENDQRVLDKGRETDTYKFRLPESVRQDAGNIDEALADIKVCDPAIGSGAFPVGLLHEIVNTRLALAPHSGNDSGAYELKRHAISESIYGVDIDASAIDIARLRLWLSLIVDEEDYDTIEALPNLDYKIVCGDSLLSIEVDLFNQELFGELEQKKSAFLNTTSHKKKRVLADEIDDLIHQITDGKEIFDFRVFFSEVWHEKGGFDVVVGNPPYGAVLSDEHKKVLKLRFSSIVDRIRNSFLYFIGVSESLISSIGAAVLIVPNEFLFQIYMGKARKHYLSNRRLFLAINIGEKAFKAIVPTCVIGFDAKKMSEYEVLGFDLRSFGLKEIEKHLSSIKLNRISNTLILERPNHTFSFDPKANSLVKDISRSGRKLNEFCLDVANGISTSCDGVYIVDNKVSLDRGFEKDYLKATLKGKDIERFRCPETITKYILYVDKEFKKNDAPNIIQYLKENKEKLISKSVEKRKGSREWHILFRSRYKELFAPPKILVRQTGDSIVAAFDRVIGYYCIDSINIVQLKPELSNTRNFRYIVGLLNSEVLNFYYQQISQESGRVMAQVKPSRLKELPIKYREDGAQISDVVQFLEVLTSNKSTLEKAFFSALLNGLVYELYFLDDIKVANKEVLPHLGELTPITDDMSKEEKLAIIQREFERLYDLRHPVRNNLETLDSVDAVRTIREALKK